MALDCHVGQHSHDISMQYTTGISPGFQNNFYFCTLPSHRNRGGILFHLSNHNAWSFGRDRGHNLDKHSMHLREIMVYVFRSCYHVGGIGEEY